MQGGDIEQALRHGVTLQQAGRHAEARAVYRNVLKRAPRHPEALHLLGLVAFETGDATRAAKTIRKALAILPGNPIYLSSLGLALKAAGKLDPARQAFEKALRQRSPFPQASFNLGVTLMRLDRAEAAFEHLTAALAGMPGDIETLIELAKCEAARGDIDAAAARLREIVGLRPDHVGALRALAELPPPTVMPDEALSCLEKAVGLAPGDTDLQAALAMRLEGANRLDDAAAVADRIAGHPVAEVALAQVAFRRDDLAGARVRLEALLARRDVVPETQVIAHNRLAMVCDRQGDYATALAAQNRSGKLHGNSPAARHLDPAGYRALVAGMAGSVRAAAIAEWTAPAADDLPRDPVFLVGFPRSGTTLVERALAAHPNINASDEYPALERVIARIADYPDGLGDLDGAALAALRADYWRITEAAFGAGVRQGRYLDKAPMNIVHLGAVQRLFPDARVLVALRDPRDVCVSCFLQDFVLNEAMMQFLTLDGAAAFYASVMGLWRHYKQVLTVPTLDYRYEDAVTDFEGTLRRLLDFIGESWDPAVVSREERARTMVATPSYRDIGSEVYSRAVGRWQNYAGAMAGSLPLLAPFVEDFGYPP